MGKNSDEHIDCNIEVQFIKQEAALSRDGSGHGPKEPLKRKTVTIWE